LLTGNRAYEKTVGREKRVSFREVPMASEWRLYIDVKWYLDRTNVIVQRSTDVLIGSRRALAELHESKATTRERLATSWALLTKRTNAPATKSTASEKPTLPPPPQPPSRL